VVLVLLVCALLFVVVAAVARYRIHYYVNKIAGIGFWYPATWKLDPSAPSNQIVLLKGSSEVGYVVRMATMPTDAPQEAALEIRVFDSPPSLLAGAASSSLSDWLHESGPRAGLVNASSFNARGGECYSMTSMGLTSRQLLICKADQRYFLIGAPTTSPDFVTRWVLRSIYFFPQDPSE
jgi:hypothetical protein